MIVTLGCRKDVTAYHDVYLNFGGVTVVETLKRVAKCPEQCTDEELKAFVYAFSRIRWRGNQDMLKLAGEVFGEGRGCVRAAKQIRKACLALLSGDVAAYSKVVRMIRRDNRRGFYVVRVSL